LVSGRTVFKVVLKSAGAALLAGTSYLTYQFTATSFASTPLIGAVTGFFMALAVLGSLLILLS